MSKSPQFLPAKKIGWPEKFRFFTFIQKVIKNKSKKYLKFSLNFLAA
jgi:hypothetical protein